MFRKEAEGRVPFRASAGQAGLSNLVITLCYSDSLPLSVFLKFLAQKFNDWMTRLIIKFQNVYKECVFLNEPDPKFLRALYVINIQLPQTLL